MRVLIAEGADPRSLREAAVAAGMATVRDGAVGLCLDGVTTTAEVLQVPRD
jgi:type II secretory ATPase GspE/PulE/Tfp pilus assembly ATPase PilB-like protein